MTLDEVLKANPTSIIICLVNPYDKTVRFVREDEYGQHPCEMPDDWKLKPGYSVIQHA